MLNHELLTEKFTFLCSKYERRLIAVLAHQLKRSQSDAIRFLIRAAAQELDLDSKTNYQENSGEQ